MPVEETILDQAAWTPGEAIPADVHFGIEIAGQTTPRKPTLAQIAVELNANNLVGDASTFPTLADLVAANVPGTVDSVLVIGHTTSDDAHTQRYKRDAAPAGLGKVQSADGAWWLAYGTADVPLDAKHHAVNAPGDKSELEAYYKLAVTKPLNPRDYPWNLVMDYPTSGDEGAALQQFLDDIADIGHHDVFISGYVGTSIGLTIFGGAEDNYLPHPKRFDGRLIVQATTAIVGPVVTINGFYYGEFMMDLYVFGTGGSEYATRTCREAVLIGGYNARGYFGGHIYTSSFLARGITIDSDIAFPPAASNSNSASFASLSAHGCGTGPATPVTDTFTWVSDEGPDATQEQRSVITLGSAPDPDLNFIIINGKAYKVDWTDPATTGNDIAVENWIYAADRTAGTLTLVIGYGVKTYGADVNNLVMRNVVVSNTSLGLWCAGLKWPVVENLHAEPCHIALALGDRTNAAGEGAWINLYSEGSDIHCLIVTNVQNANTFVRFMIDDPDLLGKVQKLGPLFAGTDYASYQKLSGYRFDFVGAQLREQGNHSQMLNDSTPTMEVGPQSTRTLNQDAATITLKYRPGRDKYFGYSDITIICRGTGPRGQPTGTYTLVPEDAADALSFEGVNSAPGASVPVMFAYADVLRCTYIFADKRWKVSRQSPEVLWQVEGNAITGDVVSGDSNSVPGNYQIGTRLTPLTSSTSYTPVATATVGQQWLFAIPGGLSGTDTWTFVTGGSFDNNGSNFPGNIIVGSEDAAGQIYRIVKKSATLYEVAVEGNVFDVDTLTTMDVDDEVLVKRDSNGAVVRMEIGNLLGTTRFNLAGDALTALQPVTKQQLDGAITNAAKPNVRVATTMLGTLASSFEVGDTIDGVVLVLDDRILIKNQTAGEENGIYTVNASGAPTRATDLDSDAEADGGANMFVDEGTVNADTGWRLVTQAPITLDTTSLQFDQMPTVATSATAVTADTHDDIAGTNVQAQLEEIATDRVKGTYTLTGSSSVHIDGSASAKALTGTNRTLAIPTGGVTATQLGADSVTTAKVANDAITNLKLADMGQYSVKLNPGATNPASPVDGFLAASGVLGRVGSGDIVSMTPKQLREQTFQSEFVMVSGTLDCDDGRTHIIQDNGAFTIPLPVNYIPGEDYQIVIDAGDQGDVITWNAGWKISSADSLPAVRPATGRIILSYMVSDLAAGGPIYSITRVDFSS